MYPRSDCCGESGSHHKQNDNQEDFRNVYAGWRKTDWCISPDGWGIERGILPEMDGGRICQVYTTLVVLTVRYVNQCSTNTFETVASTMVALKEQRLLVPSSTGHDDGNGRINGHVIRKQSEFMETLVFKVSEARISDAKDLQLVNLWRELQILDLLGVHQPQLDDKINLLLRHTVKNQGEENCGPVFGLLLSLGSGAVPKKDQDVHAMEIVESFWSRDLHSIVTEIRVLEGLEKLLLKTSRYL
jgi:hypothetical protein